MKGKAFTKEQQVILQQIANTSKDSWSKQIHDALPAMGGRSYGHIWNKVYSMSGIKPAKRSYNKKPGKKPSKASKVSKDGYVIRRGETEEQAKIRREKDRLLKEKRRREKASARGGNKAKKPPKYTKSASNVYKSGGSTNGKKRSLHHSPLRGTTMVATANELRFPIQSLRIEGGELIVTFK
jgi:hypothetical protein